MQELLSVFGLLFSARLIRQLIGINMTNMEVLSRTATGQRRLQDIVAERRLRKAGHIIRMPPGRPAKHAISWTPRGSGRRQGRPTKTWRSTYTIGGPRSRIETASGLWLQTGADGEHLLPLSCQGPEI